MVMIHFGATRKIYETIYKEWVLVNEYRVPYFYRSTVKVLPVFPIFSPPCSSTNFLRQGKPESSPFSLVSVVSAADGHASAA